LRNPSGFTHQVIALNIEDRLQFLHQHADNGIAPVRVLFQTF